MSIRPPSASVTSGATIAPASNLRPAGSLRETVPRSSRLNNTALLSSGRLHLVAIDLPLGLTVTSISFLTANSAAGTPTNQWFGLFDSSRVALRLTADDTTTAWAATSVKTLALTAPFVTTYEGLHYLGINITAVSVPNMFAADHASDAATKITPILSGHANPAQTSPPALPFTAIALSANANVPYAFVS